MSYKINKMDKENLKRIEEKSPKELAFARKLASEWSKCYDDADIILRGFKFDSDFRLEIYHRKDDKTTQIFNFEKSYHIPGNPGGRMFWFTTPYKHGSEESYEPTMVFRDAEFEFGYMQKHFTSELPKHKSVMIKNFKETIEKYKTSMFGSDERIPILEELIHKLETKTKEELIEEAEKQVKANWALPGRADWLWLYQLKALEA